MTEQYRNYYYLIQGVINNESFLDLSGIPLFDLPDKIKEMSNLKELIINNTDIYNLSILENINLEILDIRFTNINDLNTLLDNLKYLKNIKEIKITFDISKNNFIDIINYNENKNIDFKLNYQFTI